jgi:hypothetical protein
MSYVQAHKKMVIFKSESDFLETIAHYDNLVRLCNEEIIDFEHFLKEYNYFYSYLALDGHESDSEEKILFQKYMHRIEPHRKIYDEILTNLCSDNDAELEIYQKSGRFGRIRALFLLKQIEINAQ